MNTHLIMTTALAPSFVTGARSPKQFPADTGLEIAFAGRSNSGKSSAINAITERKGLARTSKTPGRTREINFFGVREDRRLVDLPGYGYAKVSASVRDEWRELLEQYFRYRQSLRGLFVTVDIRRGIGDLDRVMLRWAHDAGVPAAALLTKADKLSRSAGGKRRDEIAATSPIGVPLLLFSAPKRLGIDAARDQLAAWLELA